MNPIIKVENLGKQYRIGSQESAYSTLRETMANGVKSLIRRRNNENKTIWALRNVSFEVAAGEVIGIIGRNGAGKSTLLKVLSRITEPTDGRIELRGRVGSLLEVGTGFHPELTGRENIYLNGSILGMRRTEIARKFDEMVAFAEIEKFVDTPVKRYSSGMYLRLAFAVAAHLDPEILLVDEVLAVGDVEFQKKCLGKMEEVAGQGRTILFVSHNIPAIQRLCSRAILLREGQVAEQGPTGNVVRAYLTLGLEQSGERVWDDSAQAPGDDVVRLKAIRSLDSNLQVASEFTVRDEWYLETEFWVLVPGQCVYVHILIYDEAGTLVFFTGDFQDTKWHQENRPPGIHTSRCKIPRDFLNTGSLRILVGLVTPPTTLRAIERDAIAVKINETLSTDGARGFYPNDWPGGAVRPRLSWDFDYRPQD